MRTFVRLNDQKQVVSTTSITEDNPNAAELVAAALIEVFQPVNSFDTVDKGVITPYQPPVPQITTDALAFITELENASATMTNRAFSLLLRRTFVK